MMHRVNILGLFLLLAAACGDDDGPSPGTDSGPLPGDDAGEMSCTIPDTTCPEDQPFAGAACDTSESCMYVDPVMMGPTPITWTYTCMGSRWSGTNDCMPAPGGSCPVGPLAEGCRMPFEGTLAGATVEIGPGGSDAFRPFMPDEPIDLMIGGQGSAMVSVRVRVTGADAPRCVLAASSLTIDGTLHGAGTRPIVLHCGETLSFFLILPEVCAPGTHRSTITIDLMGLGTGTATVTHDPTPCFG